MKLVTFRIFQQELLGLLTDGRVYPVPRLGQYLPGSMQLLLSRWERHYPVLLKAEQEIRNGIRKPGLSYPVEEITLLAPVPKPSSCRDAITFQAQAEGAGSRVPVNPAFDQYPTFHFSNHQSIQGPGPVFCMPDHLEELDFELEVAAVICKKGHDIKAADADSYIAGLLIMNDLSARSLQQTKGKDFATTIGPWLVTTDELAGFETTAKKGHTGKAWDLTMTCKVNGEERCRSNLADMPWTFAELIETASYGVELYPGDVIGSGTVGIGSLLELNESKNLKEDNWLKTGDSIEMEVTGLGTLRNDIAAHTTAWRLRKQLITSQ